MKSARELSVDKAVKVQSSMRSALPVSLASAKNNETSDGDALAVVAQIRSDPLLAAQIKRIRETFNRVMQSTNGDRAAAKDAIAHAKKTLPAVMLSGTFSKRNDKALLKHSGLLCADLDGLGAEGIAEAIAQLIKSPYVWAIFISPTGDGLKVVFRVRADGESHLASFRAVRQHVLELTGLQVDESCKNVGRLCFLSHDPDAYLNEDAIELPPLVEAEDRKKSAPPVDDRTVEARRKIAIDLLGEIDWQSDILGYCTCPGQESHTTGDGHRDCQVMLDGVPTIYCLHNSCGEVIEAKNFELRSRIEETENGGVGSRSVDPETIVVATYFIEDKYWKKSDDVWRPTNRQNFADDLRVLGINARPSSKADRASDVLRLMSRIRSERVLDAALPIVHDRRELINLNGRDILNISRIRAMQPAEADDPEKSAWLHEFFQEVWDPAEMPRQRDHFLAWFQRYYRGALEGNPLAGQAVFIAGEQGIGKTFMSWRVIGRALGGFSDGAQFMKGETTFNKEIAEVPLLAIDDSLIADDVSARNKFTSAIKKFVADPRIQYHPKGIDAISIPCKNRIIVTCNVDPHSLAVLPRIDVSIEDKLMFFKLGDWRPSYDLPGGAENYVAEILPYWLRWLLEWKPPAYVVSSEPRYGIVPYHHPFLVRAVQEESAGTTLKQLIDIMVRERGMTEPEWMSSRELHRRLSFNDANRIVLAQDLGGPRLGRTLSALGKDYVLDKRTNTSTNAGEYLITSPEMKKQ